MFLCVSNKEEIISEFKNSQHNLENMVIFIHNKCVFYWKPRVSRHKVNHDNPMAFFTKKHDICPINLLNDMSAEKE